MRKQLSRILALVLAVSISLNSLPLAAFATDSTPVAPETQVTESVTPSPDTTTQPEATETPVENPEEPDNALNGGSQEVSDVENTAEPTSQPSADPSTEPTVEPTTEPTAEPTAEPTVEPTVEPTAESSVAPSVEPSTEPVQETKSVPEQTGYNQPKTADEGVAYAAVEGFIDAVIFCSDVHKSSSDLTSVMTGVKTSNVTYSAIGFVGDTCLTVANTENAVKSGLGYTPKVMFSYAAGHDTENGADISTNWNYSGEVEGVSENYLVYTIRETDMESSSSTAPSAFTTWYNGLTAKEKALPIFIMSHKPLHARRNDNAGAANWYSAISAAAESSDIVFLWGHNHTSESSADTNAYYVAKDGDEKLEVYKGSSVVPNFTYMNAGYINANGQNPARKGVATTVQITADSLVFQNYTTSGEYTGTYANNVTVAREFATPAVTLSSISVTTLPTKVAYTVGDTFDATGLVVTGLYSDDSDVVITDYELSVVDMSTAGTKTVKVTYSGLETSFEITVAEPTEQIFYSDESNWWAAVTATAKGAEFTEIVEDGKADELMSYWYGYAISLEGQVEDTATTVMLWLDPDAMSSDNLAVYYYNETTGRYEAVTGYTVATDEYSVDYITIANANMGKYVYGTPAVRIPENAVLDSLTVVAPEKVDYFDTDAVYNEDLQDYVIYVDLTGMSVTANYVLDGKTYSKELSWNTFDNTIDGYALLFDGLAPGSYGEKTVTVSYGDKTETFTETFVVKTWPETVTSNGITVKVTVGEFGVEALNVAPSENKFVADAVKNVITGENYVAYDISLQFAEGYSATDNIKTVTLPIPEGVTNPVVYYVSDNGYNVIDMNAVDNGDGTVSFETTHFSTYVVGEKTEIEVEPPQTAEGSNTTTTTEPKEVYVLVSTPTAGKQYIIVNRYTAGSGYALKENTTTGSSVTVNAAGNGISAPYIETTDKTIMWNTASGMTFKSENGGYYLNSSNSSLTFSTRFPSNWTVGENQLYYDGSRNDYWLRYNDGWTMGRSGTEYNVYFFEKQTVSFSTTVTVSGSYNITIEADEDDNVTVPAIKDATFDLTSILTFTPTSGTATTEDVSATAKYEIVTVGADGSTVNGDPLGVISSISGNTVTLSGAVGKALVKVSYERDFGTVTDYITVTAYTPHHFSIQLHLNEGGTLGEEITKPVALKGIKAGDTYSVWAVVKAYVSEADTKGVDIGTLGDKLSWTVSDESIATINTETGVITFTGTNYGTFTVTAAYQGSDRKTITDTITISVTESQYVVPGDGTNDFPEYPNEGAVRFDKTATAVGNYSETGIAMVELSMTGVPYSTGSELDVVLMLDMTGSMSDEMMVAAEESAVAFVAQIVKNEDGTYNDNRVAVYTFNSDGDSPFTLVALGTIDNDEELDAANAAIRTADTTQASGGTPYNEALEQCQTVLKAAKTTNLPEGVESAADYNRKQFCVFMSDGGPTSFEYITNYDAVKAGTATAYTKNSATASGGSNQSDSNFATIAGYTHEYYSTLMKDDGVTMFSVLTGLSAESYPNCATILRNIASSSANAYVVPDGKDTSAVSGALSSIAQKIVEAAKDVKVEDKIGNNYSMNFSMPSGVSEEATEGLKEFYIQVVEYQLNADKERTGTPAVLENFTFNSDGTLKSHTVDGVACTNCDHVTTTNNTITAIDGTYFNYKSDSTGEYINWEVDKITTTELALQYFAHLDGSTGLNAGTMPAGTYYTNEYATFTYTNFNGNEVQREFPKPQMTWNGAQVSYVFYLVNEAGQPVNRAGRVVPFAEAVYVTDVYTKEVVWNDLEQSAGLEAKYLAKDLVPDVYALYDEGAQYNIHVYEDENEVNLNNHFKILGNSTTTYVFNNKSDKKNTMLLVLMQQMTVIIALVKTI